MRKIVKKLKMVLVEIYVRVNCWNVQKLTERLLEKRIGVRKFTAVGVRVYTTGLRIRARRTVLRLAEEINRVSLSKIPYN